MSLFPFPTVGTRTGTINVQANKTPVATSNLNFDPSFTVGSDGLGTTTVSVLPPGSQSSVLTSDYVVTQRGGALAKVTQGAFWTQNLASQAITTVAVPAVSLTIPQLTGAMQPGAAQAKYFNFQISQDRVDQSTSLVPTMANFTYFFGGTGQTGSRVALGVNLNQAGALAPSSGHTTIQPTVATFFGKYNNTAGGSGMTATTASGLAYTLNLKSSLQSGALNWGMLNAVGEVNFSVVPASQMYSLTGTVNTGGTWAQTFTSSLITGGTVTLTDTAVTGDTLAMRVQRMAALIMRNDTLRTAGGTGVNTAGSSGIGVAVYGANNVTNGANYRITWPAWMTDLVITNTIAAGGGETVSLNGAAVVGASALKKHGMTFIASHDDGTAGYAEDSLFVFNKQHPDNSPSTGAWKAIFTLGGGVLPADDGSTTTVAGWPLDPFGTVFNAVLPTGSAGGQDTPAPQSRMYSFVDYRNVDFGVSQGRPLQTPGFATFWDGATRIGSLNITRITGNAVAPVGVQFSASGWECTGITVTNGGGSGSSTNYSNRYFVGDLIPYMEGTLQVNAVDSTGAVAVPNGLTVVTRPVADAGSSPATTGINLSNAGGTSGTGLIINATWTQATILRLGGTGQTVQVAGAPLAFLDPSTTATTHDAKISVAGTGAGGVDGQGVLSYLASQHNFKGGDGSTQLAVGNMQAAVEYFTAIGGRAGQGATLAAGAGVGNVQAAVLASGTGSVNFGNGTGLGLVVVDPAAPVLDWMTIAPAISTSSGVKMTLAPALTPTTTGVNLAFGNIAGGVGCVAGGSASMAFGLGSQVFGTNSQARGAQAYVTNYYGVDVWANGFFANIGDCQKRDGGILRGVTTSASAVRLTADGTGTANTTNCVNLHNNQVSPESGMLSITGDLICRNTSSGKGGRWLVKAVLTKLSGTTTLDWLSVAREYVDAGIAAIVDPTVVLDATNAGLNISPTGLAATTLHWQFIYRGGEVW